MRNLDSFLRILLITLYGINITDAGCGQIKADIVFLIDASGSVGDDNFVKELGFAADFSSAFQIGHSALQVGVVRFSDVVAEIFNLQQYDVKADLITAIRNIVYTRGSTATDLGLDFIHQNGFTAASGDRHDAPNIVIVLTDGRSDNAALTAVSAKKLRDMGVEIYALGIGHGIQSSELRTVATDNSHVIMVDGFDELAGVKDTLHNSLCSDLDPCFNNPCQNGGSCHNTDGTATCRCVPGYTGSHCESDIDECSSQIPCHNGATCTNTQGSYTCTCSSGYTGSTCDQDINECATNTPCQHGATCTNTQGSYNCRCSAGFTGNNCQTATCKSGCSNGGTCVLPNTCSCPSGFTGLQCQYRCGQIKADIIFLIDASGSVGDANFVKELGFAADLSGAFQIGPSALQVGVVRFSDVVAEMFNLQQYDVKADLITAIRNITYTRGSTATDRGLDFIRQNGFTAASGDRPDAPNIVIVLTDGRSDDSINTAAIAKQLRDMNVEIYTIGIGQGIRSTELETVATDSSHVIMVDGFVELAAAKNTISTSLCSNIDECQSSPCQHGGTCIDEVGSYTCQCASRYTGTRCQTDMCADVSPDCDQLFGVCMDPVKRNTLCRGTCGVCGHLQIELVAGPTHPTTPSTTPGSNCRDLVPDCGQVFGVCLDTVARHSCKRTCGQCDTSQVVVG